MNCVYNLKGKKFNSEFALDEYLINIEDIYDKIGDEVFQWSAAQNRIHQTLIALDQKKNELYQNGYMYEQSEITDFSEDHYQFKLPYIGVSRFLQRFTIDDDPLFKSFAEDDYWNEKRKDWSSEEYWKNQASLEEIKQVFGTSATEGKVIHDQSEFDLIKEKIKEQWKQQSYLGTAVHAAMSAYWLAVKSRKLKIDYKDVDQLVDFFRKKLDREVSKEVPIKLNTFLTDEHLKQIAVHAQNIHQELITKFTVDGQPPTFMSEIGLTASIDYEGRDDVTMVGVADLLVIDALGNIQVIDYKTSTKTYQNYNPYKKKTFYYQLATYRRMLERQFSLTDRSRTFVIPLQFKDFMYENDVMSFSEIYNPALDNNGQIRASYLEEIDTLVGPESKGVISNLNRFLPIDVVVDDTPEAILEKNQEFMKECFTAFYDQFDLSTDKVIKKIKKQHGGQIKKDKKINKYVYNLGTQTITADTEQDLIQKVLEKYKEFKELPAYNTQGLKNLLRTKRLDKLGKMKKMRQNSIDGQVENILSRYTMYGWEIIDGPKILETLGIILIKNKSTKQIDVVKVSESSWQELSDVVKLGGQSYEDKDNKYAKLSGQFEPDVKQMQKPNSKILDSTFGNIELMQTVNVLDMLPRLFGDSGYLGQIMVVDLKKDQTISPSNDQVFESYKTLQRFRKIKETNYDKKVIKVLDKKQIFQFQFNEIMSREKDPAFTDKDKWLNVQQCTPNFDNMSGNIHQFRTELVNFVDKLEKEFKLSPEQVKRYKESNEPQNRLYYNALMAIAEIDGVDFKQQMVDHWEWVQPGVKGWAATMLDNPGNMLSSTLNYVSEQVNIAYQNVRDDITKLNAELRKKLNALKREQEFNWVYTRTVGNQTDLYQNMYDKETPGKFLFKNPFDSTTELSDAERDFLQFALLVINGNRYKIRDAEELIQKMNEDGYEKYLRVPLTKGSTASRISTEGLLNTLKGKLTALLPENIVETAKEKVEGFISSVDDTKYNKAKSGELWEMTNYFDAGENEAVRLAWFSDANKGISFFEHNLETLTLKHAFAFSMKENMDKVFPIIKAARMHLFMQGAIMNDNFEKDIKYLSDFIKAKIFNMSLAETDAAKVLQYVTGEIMQMTSKLALAFNPRQLYQVLDGIWKDISLVWRKPDGDTSFTKDNMMDSFFWIMSDLKHFGDEKSMGELFNEQYGLNDMDMNSYVDKINSDNVGIFNFWSVGFRFSSRPDYYNRMTLFGAQMRGDGCFEAHYVENGRLKYDWTKDKRFSKYAESLTNKALENDPEVKKQKALYIATAKQFEAEHAKNDDGTDFILDLNNPQALPKAYTIQQSESIKALSDLVYGYYSHEKKSLIQSMTLGSMFFQMATYWSSKKNQYLAPGGIKMQGRMKHYVENGVPMYHKLDANGVPTDEMTTENTGVPYMQWAGQWQEGILITLIDMFIDVWQGDGSLGDRWGNMWQKYMYNEDENLRRAYRNNLKQFTVDLVGGLFIGNLVFPSIMNAVNDYTKEVGNDTFTTALINNSLINTVEMFDSSLDDFQWWNGIFGKGLEWTPVSVSSMSRLIKTLSRLMTGDNDMYDSLFRLFSATRGQEPIFDFLKMQLLGRSIGDNGREE